MPQCSQTEHFVYLYGKNKNLKTCESNCTFPNINSTVNGTDYCYPNTCLRSNVFNFLHFISSFTSNFKFKLIIFTIIILWVLFLTKLNQTYQITFFQ